MNIVFTKKYEKVPPAGSSSVYGQASDEYRPMAHTHRSMYDYEVIVGSSCFVNMFDNFIDFANDFLMESLCTAFLGRSTTIFMLDDDASIDLIYDEAGAVFFVSVVSEGSEIEKIKYNKEEFIENIVQPVFSALLSVRKNRVLIEAR